MDETIPMDGPHYEQISGILMGGYWSGPDAVSIFWGLCCKNYSWQLCAGCNGEMNGWVSKIILYEFAKLEM